MVAANARPARCGRTAGGNMWRRGRTSEKMPGLPKRQRCAGPTSMIRAGMSGSVGRALARRRWRAGLTKILRLEFDRLAVRRAVGGMVPGVAVAMERLPRCHALFRHQSFQSRQPVPVIGFAGVGVASRLRALNLLAKRRGPLLPGEDAAPMQRHRHGEGVRLPGFAEHRAVVIAWNARDVRLRNLARCIPHAGSRYGSNASIEIFTVGSPSLPQSSAPSNTTV